MKNQHKPGKRKVGVCVYCGQTAELTRDHVIPKCLFEKPYPLDMITIQCCDACNNEKSKDDDYLRDLLTVDIYGYLHPVAQRIVKSKVCKSYSLGSSIVASEIISKGQMTPFHSHGGVYLGDVLTVQSDGKRLKRIIVRIIRGLYYEARKLNIPIEYDFQICRFHPGEFGDMLHQLSATLCLCGPRRLGDVFGAFYTAADEDPSSTVWYLWFYGGFCLSISAISPMFRDLHPLTLPLKPFGNR